jgi:hypothetical protein
MRIVEPGPAFILTSDGSNWSSDASLDLERASFFGSNTVASLVIRLTNVEPGSKLEGIEGVGIELTRNDLLYIARDLNQLYEDIWDGNE